VSITDSDLRTRLRTLPAKLPRRELGPAFPDAVRAGARRRRNRARVASAAALVVLVAAAVGIPVGLLRGSGTASIIPARPPAPSSGGFMVYGAKVGWLPHGYVVADDQFQDVTRPTPAPTPYTGGPPPEAHYTEQWVRLADPADVAAVRAAAKPHLDGPQYVIDVLRGQVPTAAEAKALAASAKIGETFTDVTVAGHPATLAHSGVAQPAWAWILSWWDGTDASVSVSGSDEDVVWRIAENVTLGPVPSGPADSADAAAQIRDTARKAFQGSAGLGMLDFVYDHDGLARRAVDNGLSRGPGTGATVSLYSVGDIVFLGPTEAGTRLKIQYLGSPNLGRVVVDVRITLTTGGWKVTRESFCKGMYDEFRGCPTIP
jgi:hypothetical protein